MHYTGTIWRPPYEASSLLLEATAGCTHHKCKFCTLYQDLPFPFWMSPSSGIRTLLTCCPPSCKGFRGQVLSGGSSSPVQIPLFCNSNG